MFENFVHFVREYYGDAKNVIPLHAPVFRGNERKYVLEALDSTFVSSVGPFVDQFERLICKITGAKFAVATVNGTAALHMALHSTGVTIGHEIITQPLSFVALANAIAYTGATPLFVDIDPDTLSLSPEKLGFFLENSTTSADGVVINKSTGRRISGCMPMHTFGFPARMDEIMTICESYGIAVFEDASESIGSQYKSRQTGTFGRCGVFSLNGNKTVTSGGGGVIVTNDEPLAKKMKHLTTTAKTPHRWEFHHDAIGFNYRLPNINAALACAQLEQLDAFIQEKRQLARRYQIFFENSEIRFFREPESCISNYWLNAILLKDRQQQQKFLEHTNDKGINTRPAWQLLHTLPMYEQCPRGDLTIATEFAERLVNIPSGIRGQK